MTHSYIAPKYELSAFNCPHCNVYAQQYWSTVFCEITRLFMDNTKITVCHHCRKRSFWINQKMIYPSMITVPQSHHDMPTNVKELYDEARLVSNLSPRSSATLLRVALERLTENLGETTGNLNTRISKLNAKGLPESVIKVLDVVRIHGNDGAHNNQMDMNEQDTPEIVNKLFWMINYIVEKVITEPNEINIIFQQLPESKLKAIEDRDNKK